MYHACGNPLEATHLVVTVGVADGNHHAAARLQVVRQHLHLRAQPPKRLQPPSEARCHAARPLAHMVPAAITYRRAHRFTSVPSPLL